jgi:putative tributyrin esterase
MALLNINFYSSVLGMNCQMDVILPQKKHEKDIKSKSENVKYPVLWLLHGGSDDQTAWQRHTSIERYVEGLGIAVVMPAAHMSLYSNMACGGRYFDYIAEELPQIVREFFPISERREDNYIAGLSMGGYGAMKVGLSKPENFCSIGCFSAGNMALDDEFLKPGVLGRHIDNLKWAFGTLEKSHLEGSEHDLFALADRAITEGKSLPRIFHAVGIEDIALKQAQFTSEWFKNKPFDYIYNELPGTHSWKLWDELIQKYLIWLMK